MDNLMSTEIKHEKIKTCFAQIIAEKIMGKPYYSIMYWQDGDMHIGYSSYELEYVRRWLNEEFDVNRNADVAPVVHGRFVVDESTCPGAGLENYKCSVCGRINGSWLNDLKPEQFPNYCWNCGAKMDKEDEKHETD